MPRRRPTSRRLEFVVIAICLFLMSGAVFPPLMESPDGSLSGQARSVLRLLALPVYLFAIVVLARHWGQWVIALRRSLPLLILTALPILSVVWSIAPGQSLRRVVALLFSILFAYALAIRLTPRQLLHLVSIVLGTCMVMSLALWSLAPHLAMVPGEAGLRGVFDNKNVLGWVASLATVAAAVLIYDREGGHQRLGWIVIVPSAACLLLSGSATSLLSAICGLGLGLFYELLKRNRGMGRTLLVLVLLELTAVFLIVIGDFLVPILSALGKDVTLTGRIPLWDLVDLHIAERPAFGYGYQAFWTEGNGAAWAIWSEIAWQAPHAHNGYRDILLSLGVAGLLAFAAVLVIAIRQGAALHCASTDRSWLWPNMLIGQVLITNLSESNLLAQNDFQWTLFAIVVIAFGCRAAELRPVRIVPRVRAPGLSGRRRRKPVLAAVRTSADPSPDQPRGTLRT